jgi:hypothetical protein
MKAGESGAKGLGAFRTVFVKPTSGTLPWWPRWEPLNFGGSLGAVAQLGEHLVCNQGVAGSIPVRSIPHNSLPSCHSSPQRPV